MKKVCVITGGGSGMGLAAAMLLGKDHYIIIAGRTVSKLEGAINELKAKGIEAEAQACDVSDRKSVENLARRAKEIGTVASVIHSAGISPNMGEAQSIIEINALGTINVNEVFYEVMEAGSCLVNISSMAAYMMPEKILPVKAYKLSLTNKELFMKKVMGRVKLFPKKVRSGISYSISKNFVVWYGKAQAVKFGKKGIRILSISPGSFETPMGEVEKASIMPLLEKSAFNRMGKVEEIGELIAFCASGKPGYLTGTDILCDGGCIAGRMK